MKQDVISLFKAARRVSTPLIGFSTSDQNVMARKLFGAVKNGESQIPMLTWDFVRGLVPVNDAATSMIGTLGIDLGMTVGDLTGTLTGAARFLAKTLLVVFNAQRLFDDVSVIQSIYNLRDPYLSNMRTLVLMGPSLKMPPELVDVIVFEEDLPSDKELGVVLGKLYRSTYEGDAAKVPPDVMQQAINAARGLPLFPAEQVFAMSLTKTNGLDLDSTWERKRAAVNSTAGLRFIRGGATFGSLGGLEAWKEFCGLLNNGRRPPGVYVFIDEVEKQTAGATGPVGDSTGVSQDFMGKWLTWMEEKKHDGCLLVGPPGSGKTAGGLAVGASFDVPTLMFDIGDLKNSLLGASEHALREVLKVIDSMAGPGGAFVIATSNKESNLPPEFKRRFKKSTYFFDLPTDEEKLAIWSIHLMANNMEVNRKEWPDDTGWTGAEIRNCVETAWQFNCSLKKAAGYIVPVAKQDPSGIERLRQAATAKWLSASYPGTYSGVKTEPEPAGRAVNFDR